jgi:hypothetical protein
MRRPREAQRLEDTFGDRKDTKQDGIKACARGRVADAVRHRLDIVYRQIAIESGDLPPDDWCQRDRIVHRAQTDRHQAAAEPEASRRKHPDRAVDPAEHAGRHPQSPRFPRCAYPLTPRPIGLPIGFSPGK